MSRLKLLTFDVTNTLLKVKVSPAHQYAKAGKVFGIDVPEIELNKVYRSTWTKKKSDHPNYGRGLGMTTQEWWHDFVQRVFLNAGYAGNHIILKDVSDFLWDQFEQGMTWEVLPRCHKSLSRLKNAGMKLGVVSNFDERLEKTLVVHDLAKYFDFLVTSVSVNVEKPDPAIFRHALKLSGTDAQSAAHVGDDVWNDYQAAKGAGMHAFLLNNDAQVLTEEVLKLVDKEDVINSLKELETRAIAY